MTLSKRVLEITVFILIVLGLGGCDQAASPPDERDDSAYPGFNLLFVSDGDVELKRKNWSDFQPAFFGAKLFLGDQVKMGEDAAAVVLCDNLTAWTPPPGAPSGLNKGCRPAPDPILRPPEGWFFNTKGDHSPLIPYIISPRATRLLNRRPILRWNPSPGARLYTVRVSGGNTSWEARTGETEIVYSGDPPLEQEINYLLTVNADNGKSSVDEGARGLGFSLLPENDSRRVKDAMKQLPDLEPREEAFLYTAALLYLGNDLITEAIEILDSLAQSMNKSARVYNTLGECYRGVGLVLPAKLRYEQALERATAAGDIEGEAIALEGLAEMYARLGNAEKTKECFLKARAAYTRLGDAERAHELDKRIGN